MRWPPKRPLASSYRSYRKISSDAAGLVLRVPELAASVDLAGMLIQSLLVDVDAQPRRGRQVDVAVSRLELVGRDLVAKIDERQEIFRDGEIRHRRRGMHRRGERDERRVVV